MSAPDARSLRVVVADDDAFTISLVAGALESSGYKVTTATTVEAALTAVVQTDPHALISDLNFGTARTGADLLAKVATEFPWIGLVVLTSHRSPELAVPNPQLIPESVVYLVKSRLGAIDELRDAVERAISGAQQTEDGGNDADDDDVPVVTAAQAEVLRMLAEGASTKALADHRGTSVRAVETMLHRLFDALGIDTSDAANPRVAAVRMWQRGEIRVR
ncbi:DNA-binding NarL/FixJ family response regulator [Microcella putealis]|uniref:DNA-binding NarL/FixJ family response regulator n=2 Tax=Microcella putealis TaxID=337005 RepID=A0A4Q7LWP5_9MICO|nr:response regulator [Microcella putealis]RZS59234.1 DNA-binding NarL/FixJ family response regulator [Microcella putealis]HET8958721.1 response regulator [Microcella sp.]